jgi:hypothetical protein
MSDAQHEFGLQCPKCKASHQIDVHASVWLRLSSDGTDPYEAKNQDHEWGDDNAAWCGSCDHTGTVRDFEASNQSPMNDNEARAKRAADAVYQYVKAKGEAYEESSSEVVDLITDLLHLAAKLDQGDEPVESTLHLARMHFDAERSEQGLDP